MAPKTRNGKNSKTNSGRKKIRSSPKSASVQKNTRQYVKRRQEIYGIIIITVSLLMLFSLFSSPSSGYINERINDFLSYIFGVGKYMVPFLLLAWGVSFFLVRIRYLPSRFGWGFLLLFLSVLGLISNNLKYDNILDNILVKSRGGITGAGIFYGLFKLVGKAGAITVLTVFLVISIMIITSISLADMGRKVKYFLSNVDFRVFGELFKKSNEDGLPLKRKPPEKLKSDAVPEASYSTSGQNVEEKSRFMQEPELVDGLSKDLYDKKPKNSQEIIDETVTVKNRQLEMPIMEDGSEDENYRLPPYNLLKKSKNLPAKLYRQSIKERVNTLHRLFHDFALQAKIDRVVRGPSVTLYEVVLSPGVKVQKLFSLEDDFCVALGSPDLRIIAPIPGKSAIGLEVPNKVRSIVTLGDIYDPGASEINENLLSVPLGKNLSGNTVYMDINTMPHVLIAGATNSGKSSCLNSIIISLLMKVKPGEVKFIMIDPKMVELSIYNGIPHLLSPVVVNPKKAASALSWAVEEMEKRFRVLVERNYKSLAEYNRDAKEYQGEDKNFKPLPYIVVFIDELADLMMIAAAEVEDSICRIAQMGRAVGMHLVISTQRPSVNVITGLIKANIPSRIAFMVTSNVDSRVILDCSGADKLTGRGDMLYLPYYLNRPERLQGSFVTTKEIEMITRYIKGVKEPEYNIEISKKISQSERKDIEEDELFLEALKVAVDFGHASASLLQRRLKIGYSRAARIVDQMENRGYISGFDGSKPREILITQEELTSVLREESH